MKRRILSLLLAGSVLLAACGGTSGNGGGQTAAKKTAAETTAAPEPAGPVQPKLPKECALNEVQTVELPETGARSFSDSVSVNPGHWELTKEEFLPPVNGGGPAEARRNPEASDMDMVIEFSNSGKKTSYTAAYFWGFKDRYPAGGKCDTDFTIQRRSNERNPSGGVTIDMYFAEVTPGDDAFGQKVSVREYFEKKRSNSYPRVELSGFSTGAGEGRSGAMDSKKDYQEYYYDPECRFPQMAAEGDRICIVLELADNADGLAKLRNVWEYTWVADPPAEPEEEESHEGDSPEWIKYVYPGRWDRTNVIYAGGGQETDTDKEVSVRTSRSGVDGQTMIFTFAEKGEEKLTVTIPEEDFPAVCYPGNTIWVPLEIFCDPDTDQVPGQILASLSLFEMEAADGNKVKITPKGYFKTGYSSPEIKTFGPIPKRDTMIWHSDVGCGYLSLEGTFPEGQKEGEKLCLVYSAMDGGSGENRMYNIYEYTWTPGETVVWDHNPPMP